MKLGIILFLFIFIFGFFFIKLRPEKETVKVPSSQHRAEKYFVTDDVHYVPNVFSWGYNRHICYDAQDAIWWIFYFKGTTQQPGWDSNNSKIVYQYSNDNGETWSNQRSLPAGKAQSADFTVFCKEKSVAIAYGNVPQSLVAWIRGEMKGKKISWSKPITVMGKKGKKHFTRVAPSLEYFGELPVIAVRDQSEEGIEGGRRRVFFVMAKDAFGSEWEEESLLHDGPVEQPWGKYSSPSLFIAKGELYLLINIGYDMFLRKYKRESGTWSAEAKIESFDYNGSNLEWVHANDKEGNAYIVYPEKNTAALKMAIFNGTSWNFEKINDDAVSVRQIAATSTDEKPFVIHSSLKLSYFSNDQWKTISLGTFPPNESVTFLTSAQSVVDGKLGFAWVRGQELNPRIYFRCLKVNSGEVFDLKDC